MDGDGRDVLSVPLLEAGEETCDIFWLGWNCTAMHKCEEDYHIGFFTRLKAVTFRWLSRGDLIKDLPEAAFLLLLSLDAGIVLGLDLKLSNCQLALGFVRLRFVSSDEEGHEVAFFSFWKLLPSLVAPGSTAPAGCIPRASRA